MDARSLAIPPLWSFQAGGTGGDVRWPGGGRPAQARPIREDDVDRGANWVAAFVISCAYEQQDRRSPLDPVAVVDLARAREEILLAALLRVDEAVMIDAGVQQQARTLLLLAIRRLRDGPEA